jgi:hypothetical protein
VGAARRTSPQKPASFSPLAFSAIIDMALGEQAL